VFVTFDLSRSAWFPAPSVIKCCVWSHRWKHGKDDDGLGQVPGQVGQGQKCLASLYRGLRPPAAVPPWRAESSWLRTFPSRKASLVHQHQGRDRASDQEAGLVYFYLPFKLCHRTLTLKLLFWLNECQSILKYSRTRLIRQFAQFVTSFYPWEEFCFCNSSFAVSLQMSKQLVRVGIQTN